MHKFIWMNNWSKYGQWRHPKEWWQNALNIYFERRHPEKRANNPKLIEVGETAVVFGLNKHFGRFVLSKKVILELLYPEKMDTIGNNSKTKWQNYGPEKYPILYWTSRLFDYLQYRYGPLEIFPLITEVSSNTVNYQFENKAELYIVSKWELENYQNNSAPENKLYSSDILLIRHFVDIPTFIEIINAEVYTDVEYPNIVNAVVSDILTQNPQWGSNLLNQADLKDQIFEIMSAHFERFNFIKK